MTCTVTETGSLKFWILEKEGLYYLCSENKGADQLRGYHEADLRLCFRKCRLLVFPHSGIIYMQNDTKMYTVNPEIFQRVLFCEYSISELFVSP